MRSYLFAYGTLNPKLAPPEVREAVKQLRPVGKAAASGELLDLGDYPGAVFRADAPTAVRGTVYQLPSSKPAADSVLQKLDEYEGVDPEEPRRGLFVRKSLPIRLRSGRRLNCWVYEYNGDTKAGSVIDDGLYRKGRLRTDAASVRPSAPNSI